MTRARSRFTPEPVALEQPLPLLLDQRQVFAHPFPIQTFRQTLISALLPVDFMLLPPLPRLHQPQLQHQPRQVPQLPVLQLLLQQQLPLPQHRVALSP